MSSSYSSAFSLAIGVPCFRRPHLLAKLLDSISSCQLAQNVSVYLFDDSPEACNQELVKSYINNFCKLVYKHNAVNLGIDKNIHQALAFPAEDYVWLLGEDDLVTPDCLCHIYSAINKSRPPEVCFLAYQYFSDLPINPKNQPDPCFDLAKRGKQSYIDELLIFFGFIGSVCIKRKSLPDNSFSELGTYFAHIAILLLIIDASDRPPAVITSICSLNRVGSLRAFSWASDALNVYTGFSSIIKHVDNLSILKTLSLDVILKKAFNSFHPLAKPSRIIRLKGEGALTLKKGLSLSRTCTIPIVSLLTLLIPRHVARLALFIYYRLNLK